MTSPLATLLRDLWLHLKRTRCLIKRRHLAEVYIGDFGKKGYRTVPLYQCAYCTEIWLKQSDWKKLGGKP